MDISGWVSHWASWAPRKVAVHFQGVDISYGELDERVGRAASVLREAGVGRGDRVAHLGLNSPEMLELLFGCARLGAMFVPLNWRLTTAEHLAQLADADPADIVVERELQAGLDGVRSRLPQVPVLALGGRAEGIEAARRGDYAALRAAAPPY